MIGGMKETGIRTPVLLLNPEFSEKCGPWITLLDSDRMMLCGGDFVAYDKTRIRSIGAERRFDSRRKETKSRILETKNEKILATRNKILEFWR